MTVYIGKGIGSMRLFSRKRMGCDKCRNGITIGFGEVACYKHGVVKIKKRCNDFKYQRSKHDKTHPLAADADKLTTETMPPTPSESSILPAPPEPPTLPDSPVSPIAPEEEKGLQATSTLIADGGIEGLIKVFEVRTGVNSKDETTKKRTWIHDLFDDNGIEYHIETEFETQGRQVNEVQSIFVRPEELNDARFLISNFNNAVFITPEYSPDITTQTMVDGIPQKQCTNCNEEIDFDYHTCPHCKTAV